MKLKYYLRGLGVGILLTTLVLSAVLGKNKSKVELSDKEIIKRAEELGMVKKDAGVNIDYDAINESIQGSSDQKDSEKESAETDKDSEQSSETEESSKDSSEDKKEEAKQDNETDKEKDKNVGSIDQNATEKAEEEKESAKQDAAETEKNSESLSTDHKPDSPKKEDKKDPVITPPAIEINEKPVTKIIMITPGMSAKQVSNLLEDEGVIASADTFNLYLLDNGLTERIISQKLEIAVNTDYKTIASMLTK